MLPGVLDGERRSRLGDEPDEPFAHGKVHVSDGFGRETPGGAQCESLALGLGQVDRAHVRIEPLGDTVDDIAQRLGEIVRTRHDPGDVGEQRAALRNDAPLLRAPRALYPTWAIPEPGRKEARPSVRPARNEAQPSGGHRAGR